MMRKAKQEGDGLFTCMLAFLIQMALLTVRVRVAKFRSSPCLMP